MHILKKHNRDPGSCRPDITHQSLLMLMDSPLNVSLSLYQSTFFYSLPIKPPTESWIATSLHPYREERSDRN